ncbi:MAG: hypothetical protein LBK53_08710 [Heliobacteriaceae bacterium]|jgi:hypothetical protein|nr:hypothetical protein [Heliobacteriaceae bacterium]
MSPSHSNKNGRRYRYYVSQAIIQNRHHEAGTISKIPAEEIESFVTSKIEELIKNKKVIQEYLSDLTVKEQNTILKYLDDYTPDSVFIRGIVLKVTIYENKIALYLDKDVLVKSLEAVTYERLLNFKSESENLLEMTYETTISPTQQKGMRIIIGNNIFILS